MNEYFMDIIRHRLHDLGVCHNVGGYMSIAGAILVGAVAIAIAIIWSS